MKIFVTCALLIQTIQADVTFTPLNDTTIFIENIGHAKLYHDTWHLIVSLDTSVLNERFTNLQKMYVATLNMCVNCSEQFGLNLLNNQINRLNRTRKLLAQLLGLSRSKRGLMNFVGSISKTLFGTLDDKDLDHINNELDKLYQDNGLLASSIFNQTRIIKTFLNSTSHDLITLNEHSRQNVEKYNRLVSQTNSNTKNIAISNQITLCTLELTELSDDVNLLIDAINDGKHGIIHPQILTPTTFMNGFREFEEHNSEKYQIKLDESNYQHIVDISEITIAIVNNKLLYSIKAPLVETENFQLQRLIPIPKKIGKTFLAIIPEHEFILLNEQRTIYVPGDQEFVANCKKLDSLRICKRVQPSYLISEVYTCENQIVRNSIKSLDYKICQFSPFKINELVYLQLYQENGYIIIPEREIEINILCSEQSSNRLINGAMMLESSDDCVINSDSIIMKLRKTYETRKNVHLNKTIVIPFDATELDLIEDKMIPLQKAIKPSDLKRLGQSLDDIENSLDKVKRAHRTQTWSEKATETLSYLGYISIVITTIFILYKCGICNIVKNCLPNVCLNLLCVNNNVNNSAIPQVVTYVPHAYTMCIFLECFLLVQRSALSPLLPFKAG